MIEIVVGLIADFKELDEEGQQCEKWLYLLVQSPAIPIPRSGFSLLLPAPEEFAFEPIEARVEYATIAGPMVHVRATSDNLVIDEAVAEALLKIGYSEQLPEKYLRLQSSMVIRARKS